MAARYNEGKAIDAVIRRIEAREAVIRAGSGWSPDEQRDPDEDRRVDYVCTLGNQFYAFEHTGAATLPVTRYGDRYPYSSQKESAPGVALYRWSVPDCRLSGAFWRREFILGDLEEARRARLKRVCDDKFAKLLRWQQDEGARTVLVMEENDLSSTNHQAEAMARAEAGAGGYT